MRNRATEFWFNGYELGLIHGRTQARNTQHQQAALTARKLIAQQENNEQCRALARSAAAFLTVPRASTRPTPANSSLTVREPTLNQFLAGLRRGGILRDRQDQAA